MKIQKWFQLHSTQLIWLTALLIINGYIGKYLLNNELTYNISLASASILAVVPIAIHAAQAIRFGVISIELLVSLAVTGAFIIGEYNESAIVTFLFLIGNFLEKRTLAKTRRSVKSLTKMAPTTALLVLPSGKTKLTDTADLKKGDIILVKTGSMIPVDGTVIDGQGSVDEAALTGESKRNAKRQGNQVFSGSILKNGHLKLRTDKSGTDSIFGKIIELVEDAQDAKTSTEKFIDRFAQFYTPAVLLLALLVFLFTQNFKLAITILVLGCPGALVIGAPVSNVAGIGNGASHGILFKGGEAMDRFAKTDTFVFDKTGTLTTGITAVSTFKSFYPNSAEIIKLAAAAESLSNHPLGTAIVKYAKKHQLDFRQVNIISSQTISGRGMLVKTSKHEICLGNEQLLTDQQITLSRGQQTFLQQLQKAGSSAVIIAIDQHPAAIFGISDTLRPFVKEQLTALRAAGAKHLVMLTGDNSAAAATIAQQAGISEFHAKLLPKQKVEFIKRFQANGQKIAFIGDGINDSPALATAETGIAIGNGTDVAIETSDIVLIQSNLQALVHAYQLAQKTSLNMRENILIALLVVVFLLFGLFAGFIYLASGMFVHEASILIVIFNSMRLINYEKSPQKKQHRNK